MRSVFPLLLFLVALGTSDTRLAAEDTLNVCEVLQHPESYNGKMISIRARIRFGFEEFAIDMPPCPTPVTGDIWLEYGKGPKDQPTIWCCGDLTPQDPLVLIQDSAFRKCDSSLRATRNRMPRYTVTATLLGRFDTVPTNTCADGVHQCPIDGGFGHFGLVPSRLVIHSVSQVSAVPYSGK